VPELLSSKSSDAKVGGVPVQVLTKRARQISAAPPAMIRLHKLIF
jgi:hypothetical protein